MGEDGGTVEVAGGDVTGVAGKQGRCEKGFVRGVEEEGVRKQQNADSLWYGSLRFHCWALTNLWKAYL